MPLTVNTSRAAECPLSAHFCDVGSSVGPKSVYLQVDVGLFNPRSHCSRSACSSTATQLPATCLTTSPHAALALHLLPCCPPAPNHMCCPLPNLPCCVPCCAGSQLLHRPVRGQGPGSGRGGVAGAAGAPQAQAGAAEPPAGNHRAGARCEAGRGPTSVSACSLALSRLHQPSTPACLCPPIITRDQHRCEPPVPGLAWRPAHAGTKANTTPSVVSLLLYTTPICHAGQLCIGIVMEHCDGG